METPETHETQENQEIQETTETQTTSTNTQGFRSGSVRGDFAFYRNHWCPDVPQRCFNLRAGNRSLSVPLRAIAFKSHE